jgi:hypothetical protein
MRRFLEWLTARGILRVYDQGHLLHADGSLYMGRWKVLETPRVSVRLHHIATPDYDRHLHDHPWDFWSVVLSGGYAECRPLMVEPCFWLDADSEAAIAEFRAPGSFASRRATDRHRIDYVRPGTYTLFVYFRKRQWWGFYTPAGKVHWQDYESIHAARTIRGGE